MNCPNCGADIGSSKFCTECGTRITDTAPENTPAGGNKGADFVKKVTEFAKTAFTFCKNHKKLVIIVAVVLLFAIVLISNGVKRSKMKHEYESEIEKYSSMYEEALSDKKENDTTGKEEIDVTEDETDAPTTGASTTAAPTTTEAPTTAAPTTTEPPTTKKTGVDPEMKAFLDEYEAFIDEYIAFMNKYSSDSSNSISMLADYSKMMSRYASFADKMDKWDEKQDEMSDEDTAYYLAVQSRVTAKLYAASIY